MLSRLKSHHGRKYQPAARLGHSTVVTGDRLYLWAGWQKALPKIHTGGDKFKLTSIIEVFSLRTGEWSQLPTSGIPPLGVAYYACTSIAEDLYYFGGRCGHAGCHHNTLHQLNTVTMRWKEMNRSSPLVAPMKKAQCGMVAFRCNGKDYLLVSGGYGVLPPPPHDSTYVPKRGKPEYGWTNEAHVFNFSDGNWTVPEISGECPPACSNFSLTAINETQAVMMGGFCSNGNRLSYLYVADLTSNSVLWTKLSAHPSPIAMCDQACTFVTGLYSSGQLTQYVVATGGEDDSGQTLGSSCWLVELLTGTWKGVRSPAASATRIYHSMSSFTIGPHCVWLVLFGGVAELVDVKDWQDQPMLAATLIIELVMTDENRWTSNTVYDSLHNHSSTPDDYQRRLADRLLQARREWIQLANGQPIHLATSAQLSPNCSQMSASNSIELLPEKEVSLSQDISRSFSAEEKNSNEQQQQQSDLLERQSKQTKEMEDNLMDARRKLSESDQHLTQAEEELSLMRRKIGQLREELLASESKSKEAELKAEKTIQQLHQQTESPHWELDREEIQVHDAILQKGDWGVVKVASYRGSSVAAMLLRESVSNVDYRSAMAAASMLHCPALVQLIGATSDNSAPLVLVELIPTTLSRQLGAGPLARSLIVSIAKDVAAALCYLHHCRPPIAHGYISSTTILLERHDHSWRAKLHNSLLLHPVPPRSLVSSPYTAPELLSSSEMTTESDIYSFGSVLIEMITREDPASSETKKEQQVRRIQWPVMVGLILQCISKPDARPTIHSIIDQLSSL